MLQFHIALGALGLPTDDPLNVNQNQVLNVHTWLVKFYALITTLSFSIPLPVFYSPVLKMSFHLHADPLVHRSSVSGYVELLFPFLVEQIARIR